jgi:hypothetical protein
MPRPGNRRLALILRIASLQTPRLVRSQHTSWLEKIHSIIFVHTCVIAPANARSTQSKNVRRRDGIVAREPSMKHFMIRYTRSTGTEQDWHRDIAEFISQLDGDPDLKGKITYRCMKMRDDPNYYHLAAAADEQAIKALQNKDFFKRYAEKTRVVAGGDVVVTPMEIIAETAHRG